jgi:hypothetical protein
MKTVLALLCMGLLLGAGAAHAEEKAKAEKKPRTAISIECSKQADAKGLHGKERKTFRSACMKDGKKKS